MGGGRHVAPNLVSPQGRRDIAVNNQNEHQAAYIVLTVWTTIAILLVPGCAGYALWTGEWRWLIPSVVSGLYIWSLIR